MKPIISPHIRVRYPEHFIVDEDCIIDDFCYFSARVRIGRGCHIASGCSIAGGAGRQFTLGHYSSLSSGVKVWCTSDDFVNDLVVIVPEGVASPKQHLISGDVVVGPYSALGSNAVVMPANELPEGTAVGALSYVPPRFPFEPWSVYAGIPIRRIRARNRDEVLRQAEALDRSYQEHGHGRS